MGQVASHPPRGSNLSFPRADVRNGYSDPHSLRSWSLQIARCNGNDNPSTLHKNDDDQDGPWEVSSTYRRFNRPIRFRLEEKSPPRPLNLLLCTTEYIHMYLHTFIWLDFMLHYEWLEDGDLTDTGITAKVHEVLHVQNFIEAPQSKIKEMRIVTRSPEPT